MPKRSHEKSESSFQLCVNITCHTKPIFDKGSAKKLKLSLARDAAAKTVLNGGHHGGDPVVRSPLIGLMMAAYSVASTGRVIVVYVPVDSGKSVASEFFIHGTQPPVSSRAFPRAVCWWDDKLLPKGVCKVQRAWNLC